MYSPTAHPGISLDKTGVIQGGIYVFSAKRFNISTVNLYSFKIVPRSKGKAGMLGASKQYGMNVSMLGRMGKCKLVAGCCTFQKI